MRIKPSRPSRYRLALLRALAHEGGNIRQYRSGRSVLWWVSNDFHYWHGLRARTVEALRESGYLKWQGRSRTGYVLSAKGRKEADRDRRY